MKHSFQNSFAFAAAALHARGLNGRLTGNIDSLHPNRKQPRLICGLHQRRLLLGGRPDQPPESDVPLLGRLLHQLLLVFLLVALLIIVDGLQQRLHHAAEAPNTRDDSFHSKPNPCHSIPTVEHRAIPYVHGCRFKIAYIKGQLMNV